MHAALLPRGAHPTRWRLRLYRAMMVVDAMRRFLRGTGGRRCPPRNRLWPSRGGGGRVVTESEKVAGLKTSRLGHLLRPLMLMLRQHAECRGRPGLLHPSRCHRRLVAGELR